MSRAFVKEDDQAPPPPPLERAISTAPNLVTPRGARLIDEAIGALQGEIEAADEEMAALLHRDLRYWTARRASAQLVMPDPAPHSVSFGVRVRIRRDGEDSEIELVGEDEADPETGRIAWTSPLARALDGAEPRDIVEFAAGGRLVSVELLAVRQGSG
jgi:transcription elongation GreA/GreB family factor